MRGSSWMLWSTCTNEWSPSCWFPLSTDFLRKSKAKGTTSWPRPIFICLKKDCSWRLWCFCLTMRIYSWTILSFRWSASAAATFRTLEHHRCCTCSRSKSSQGGIWSTSFPRFCFCCSRPSLSSFSSFRADFFRICSFAHCRT